MQYLYLIKSPYSSYQSYFKVGVSSDVESRLAQLQTGNPLELTIEEVYGFENAEIAERAIHQAWKEHRVRGEWFDLKVADDAVVEIFQQTCDYLGGKRYVPDSYETTDVDVEDAENALEHHDGGRWDYSAMFADGWRMEPTQSKGINGVYWAWRKSENGKRPYIYGGRVSDLPHPMSEMKNRFMAESEIE